MQGLSDAEKVQLNALAHSDDRPNRRQSIAARRPERQSAWRPGRRRGIVLKPATIRCCSACDSGREFARFTVSRMGNNWGKHKLATALNRPFTKMFQYIM
jgi:hypothetical protein